MDELLYSFTDLVFTILAMAMPAGMIGLFIWMIVGTFQHVAPHGRLKRGVCIWKEVLPKEMEQYLRELSWDVHNERAFIRVEGQERLIRGRQLSRWRWRTSWPYVDYIDLKEDQPKLQYRMPLPNLLFLLPFMVGFFVFPLALLVFNHVMERKIMLEYIEHEMVEGKMFGAKGEVIDVI